MTTPKDKRGGAPGRRTKQQEVDAWLQGLDLPAEVVAAIRAADPRVQALPTGEPGSFSEMRDLAAQELWTYFKTAKGVAKVQAFKAIDELAKREPDGGEEAEPEPLVADIVSGVASLSAIRKREILTAERANLVEELAAVDGALEKMDRLVAA